MNLPQHRATFHSVGPDCAALNGRRRGLQSRNTIRRGRQRDKGNRSDRDLLPEFLLFEFWPYDVHSYFLCKRPAKRLTSKSLRKKKVRNLQKIVPAKVVHSWTSPPIS